MRLNKALFWISFIVGILIISIGVYFEINDLSSSGSSAGRNGLLNSTETLNSTGLFIIGFIILFFSFFSLILKKHTEKK